MKLSDVIIAPETFGDEIWCVDIETAYKYKDGARTDIPDGVKIICILPEKKMERVIVRVPHAPKFDIPNGYIPVVFEGLSIYFYWSNGQPQITAKASNVEIADITD